MKTILPILLSALCFAAFGCGGKSDGSSHNDCADCDTISDEVPRHDFSVVIEGDTVYFNIVGDGASLAYWGRSNFDNPVLHVPSRVTHEGRDYEVVEIGTEAMGVEFYGQRENSGIWAGDRHEVQKVVLPSSVKRIGASAFTARLRSEDYKVELTDSVEYIGSCAVNCMSIRDEKDAVILPANLRRIECMLDDEDHCIDGEYVDFVFSQLYIPEHLEYIGGLDNYGRNQPLFREVVVHPGNRHFKAINGTLYSYNLDSIYWSTINGDLYIPKTLRVDKSTISFLGEGWYSHVQMPLLNTVRTEPGNPYCVAIDNVLYDTVNKCLIMAAADENTIVHVPSWCNDVYTLCTVSGSFNNSIPRSYAFSADASAEDVANFIAALTRDCEGEIFSFSYKGTAWSSDQEMPDFK